MTGKEIRRWAVNQANGNRVYLVAAFLLCTAPSLALLLAGLLTPWTPPDYLAWLVRLLSEMLSFGLVFMALEQAAGKKHRFRLVFTGFQRKWLGKTLLMAVFFCLISFLLSISPDRMVLQGNELITGATVMENGLIVGITDKTAYLEGLRLLQGGNILSLLFSLLTGLLFFPLPYLLFLRPDHGNAALFRQGLPIGFRSAASVFVFRFWLMLPIIGAFFGCMVLAGVFMAMNSSFLPLFSVVLMAVTGAWYLPCILLAEARYAVALLEENGAVLPPETPE